MFKLFNALSPLSADERAILNSPLFTSKLTLEGNDLSGSIPPELGQLSSLKLLVLFENQLSGEIPK
ncbi:unnamed protein product [Chrysoparadoxa australica]